jgi:hypothetical protein
MSADARSGLRKIRALGGDVDAPIIGYSPRISLREAAFAPLQSAIEQGRRRSSRISKPGGCRTVAASARSPSSSTKRAGTCTGSTSTRVRRGRSCSPASRRTSRSRRPRSISPSARAPASGPRGPFRPRGRQRRSSRSRRDRGRAAAQSSALPAAGLPGALRRRPHPRRRARLLRPRGAGRGAGDAARRGRRTPGARPRTRHARAEGVA